MDLSSGYDNEATAAIVQSIEQLEVELLVLCYTGMRDSVLVDLASGTGRTDCCVYASMRQ